MEKSIHKNRRKLQVRNYWAYQNRRKNLQPNGGYDNTCSCGKAVEYCPECNSQAEQTDTAPEHPDKTAP